MDMDLWMIIDLGVCLIALAAAIIGAARGVGDTLIRMICIVGGIALGIFYSDRLRVFLMQTKISRTMQNRIFEFIRGEEIAEVSGAEGGAKSFFGSILTPGDSGEGVISKSLSGILSGAADNAADAAAGRLTEIAMGVIAFALIILAVSIVAFILRIIIRSLRSTSVVIGFADRVLGFVLGLVRGIMLAWIAVALLIPVTTMVSPDNVPQVMSALQETTVAKVLYDVNPFLMAINYAFR